MQTTTLGKTELNVSRLGLGASQIGRAEIPDDMVEAILSHALELGINFIDTAAMYKLSEERLGRFLDGRQEGVIVATKCGDYSVFENGKFRTVKDYSRDGVLRTIEASRKKLRRDTIDIIQFHGLPAEKGPRREAIEALLEARDRGWVRYVGISTDDPPGVDDEIWAPDVYEFGYSILHQESATTIMPAAKERNIGTIARSPIANAVYLMEERPDGCYFAGSWDRAQKVDVCALAGDIPPVEFALRFSLSHPDVHTAIVGVTKPEHLTANAEAIANGPLPDALVNQIKHEFNKNIGNQ